MFKTNKVFKHQKLLLYSMHFDNFKKYRKNIYLVNYVKVRHCCIYKDRVKYARKDTFVRRVYFIKRKRRKKNKNYIYKAIDRG